MDEEPEEKLLLINFTFNVRPKARFAYVHNNSDQSEPHRNVPVIDTSQGSERVQGRDRGGRGRGEGRRPGSGWGNTPVRRTKRICTFSPRQWKHRISACVLPGSSRLPGGRFTTGQMR